MGFTPQQQNIIDKSRLLMPEPFADNVGDQRLLAFAELVLADINVWTPATSFTTASVPNEVLPILYFGINLFAELFFQMGSALQDFSYNDNGLSVVVDQVGKIQQSYVNMLEMYRMMVTNFKKSQIFTIGAGLGTARFQSQIGQFLKVALGSSWTWNTTS